MGSYILSGLNGGDIDEQDFEAFMKAYRKSPYPFHSASVIEKVKYNYFPVWSRNKHHIFLSVNVVPKRSIKVVAIYAYVIGFILAELLTLFLPSLIGPDQSVLEIIRTTNWNSPIPILFVLGSILSLALTVFGPTIILRRYDKLLTLAEAYVKELLKQHDLELSPLTFTTNWALFPGDKYVLPGVSFILVLFQWLDRLQVLGLLQIYLTFLPLLLFLPALFIVFLIHSLAYKAIRDEADLLYFWKLRVTGLTMTTILTFVLPICFFTVSWALALITINLANQNTVVFQFHNNVSPYTSFIDAYDLGPNSAIVISAFFTWLGSFDDFYRHIWQFLFYTTWGAPLVFLLCSVLAIRKFGIFNMKLWSTDFKPSPDKQIAHRSSRGLIDIAIFLEWLIISIIKLIGSGLVIVGFLTVFHLSFMNGKLASLLLPYLWFEASSQVIIGTQIGTIVARIVLALIFLPTMLWLLLWFQSSCYKCVRSLYYLYTRKKYTSEVQKMAIELSHKLPIPTPIISIEQTEDELPVTTVIFPKWCVIHISPALIKALKGNANDLRLMLAHELGHIVKHSTKIWWAQVLSFLSLNGVGFLTLLFNYWRIETEADEYALHLTEDRRGLISLLERTDAIRIEVGVNMLQGVKPANGVKKKAIPFYYRFRKIKLIEQVTSAYNLYFATNLWGVTHPTIQERIDNLHIYTRLSPGAKRVIEYAKEEANRLHSKGVPSRSIRSEHLLFGLLSELNPLDLSIDEVRSTIEDIYEEVIADIPGGIARTPIASQIGFEPETRLVVTRAANIADTLSHHTVDPEHLWLGLLHGRDTIAIALLGDLGIDLEALRTSMLKKLSETKDEIPEHSHDALLLQAAPHNSEETGETKSVETEELSLLSSYKQEVTQPQKVQVLDDIQKEFLHPPREKYISRILANILLVIVVALILIPLSYNANVSKTTPTPNVPPSIKEVPTIPPEKGGGLDINTPIIQNSIAEVQILYPYLPYNKKVKLSTGVVVTITLPATSLQFTPWTLTVGIDGINFNTSPDQSDYIKMKKSFKEAANIVFAWIKQHGANPYKIINTWTTWNTPITTVESIKLIQKHIQEQAEKWLSEAT